MMNKINCEPALRKLFLSAVKQAKASPGEAAAFAKLANVAIVKRFGAGAVISKESQAKLDKVILSIKLSPQDLKDKTKAVKSVAAALGPLKTKKAPRTFKILTGHIWAKLMKFAGTDKKFKDEIGGQSTASGVRG